MTTRQDFQSALQSALDTYQPGWNVRHHTSTWEWRYHERWEQNRQLGVWVDTLRRWVDGDNFPRLKKFELFLESSNFPPEVRQNLYRLFHEVRVKPSAYEYTPRPNEVRIIGTPMISTQKVFVGREKAVQELRGWLNSSRSLLTIVGRSGIGKTALACHALHQEIQQGETLDAVVYLARPTLEQVYLSCAELGDNTLLRKTWASPNSIPHKLDILVNSLAESNVVLLLDEMEVVLDAQGQFLERGMEELIEVALRANSPLRLLMTSQREITLPIGFRHQHQLLPLEQGLSIEEGIALLHQIDATGRYGLREASTDQLTQLVQRVHGAPRALEVIVGVLASDRLTGIEAILEQFNEIPDIQTLLREGYRLLDDTEREILEVLAVLGHPIKPGAVAELMDTDHGTMNVMVQRLIRARLVEGNRATGEVHLPPIEADFAYQQLAEPQRLELENKAIAFYQAQYKPMEQWLTLEDVMPHLRAFDHLVKAGRIQTATDTLIRSTLRHRLILWGHIQRVIAMHLQIRGALTDPTQIVLNEYALGDAYRVVGQFEEAAQCFEKTIDMARLTGDDLHVARGLVGLGHLNRYLGNYEAAIEAYEHTLETLDEPSILGSAQIGLGTSYHLLGESERGLEFVEDAFYIGRNSRNNVLEANALQVLGEIYFHLGEFDVALDRLEEGVVLAQAAENHRGETHLYSLLSIVHGELGALTEGIQEQRHALSIAERTNAMQEQAQCRVRLGALLLQQGENSAELIADGLDIADRIGARQIQAEALYQLGLLRLREGQTQNAGYLMEMLQEIVGAIRNRADWEAWHTIMATYALEVGQLEEAQTLIQKALAFPTLRSHHQALAMQGIIKWKQGDSDGARIAFSKALSVTQVPKANRLYRADFTQGLAYVGLAMTDTAQAAQWIELAQNAYQQGRWRCEEARGTMAEARYLLSFLSDMPFGVQV